MRWSDISFTPRTLRQFAALWIAFFMALALWHGWWRENSSLGITLAVLAVTVGPLGLVQPDWIKPIYTVWMIAVFPIGWLVSLLVLALLYYGVFTPLAFVFRLMGRDPLQRQERPDTASYWQPKPEVQDPGRYLRQY